MIELSNKTERFLPGEKITGKVSWENIIDPSCATLTIGWKTAGRGDEDRFNAFYINFPDLTNSVQNFEFTLPLKPYSFTGKLISLIWFVELKINRWSPIITEKQFYLSPTGECLDTFSQKSSEAI